MPRWGGPGPLAVKPREGLGQKPSGLGDAKPAYYIEKTHPVTVTVRRERCDKECNKITRNVVNM